MIGEARDAWGHAIASERAQLLEWMQLLTCLILGVVVVVLIAKLIIFEVFIHQVRLFHDGVAHGNVRIDHRLMEQELACLPEINSLLKRLHKGELLSLQ